ncbi:MAG: NADH dehydrogenase (Ubiquinone) 24 kDa subunit [Thermotogales bacterium 46_20]|nr:MAG: NADH dehydrogenase (Ubiquinone) 24 kDa subunit [Thermotogales bacterium 46_20]
MPNTQCEQHEKLYLELDRFIEESESSKGSLINILHRAQGIFGHLSRELQEYIADKLDIPSSQVYGVVTFYNFFTMIPRGKHQIKVCMGTACYVRGADRIMERLRDELGTEGEEPTEDGLFSVHGVRCLGACSMAPVVLVGERDFYGRLKPDQVAAILEKYRGDNGG